MHRQSLGYGVPTLQRLAHGATRAIYSHYYYECSVLWCFSDYGAPLGTEPPLL